jgi:hypothetical protein
LLANLQALEDSRASSLLQPVASFLTSGDKAQSRENGVH